MVWANGVVLFLYLATFGILSAVVFFIRYRRMQDEMSYEEETTESAI